MFGKLRLFVKALKIMFKAREFFTSTTSQNVIAGGAVGTVGGGGAVLAALQFLRSTWPQYVAWPEEWDVGFAGVVTVFLTALISRVVALTRNPEKESAVTVHLDANTLDSAALVAELGNHALTPSESEAVREWLKSAREKIAAKGKGKSD